MDEARALQESPAPTTVPTIGAAGPGWLFVPADRPDRFAKAEAISDQIVIDLEDGVREDDKGKARDLLAASDVRADQACLRINGFASVHIDQDLELARQLRVGSIMVPMAEADQPFETVAGFHVVALVETARGVLEAQRIAARPEVDALALGSADLQLDLGARETDAVAGVFEDLLAFARANLLFAGRAHGVPVIDSVHPGVNDDEGLRRTAAVASAYGLDGKLAIHPKQIDIIRSAFTPSRAEIVWATSVIAEARSRSAGAFVLDGELIDEVVIRRAERLVALGG
ncbi:HpcH/HpaI aldolase/citrate lyase family protein [Brevibacterium oceani]|uniref:HpcH/HpaI aldolase/citrate lyase family protein n=1 Tax=Brevibacterium oceani TaxID=358099 RepID=UPI001B31FBB5|nr:CoA ester lyase [Brevibacterium oceani]